MIIFTLVERDSVDGSLGNGVDCAWTLPLRGCRSAGSTYLALIQLHSIFIITSYVILRNRNRLSKNYSVDWSTVDSQNLTLLCYRQIRLTCSNRRNVAVFSFYYPLCDGRNDSCKNAWLPAVEWEISHVCLLYCVYVCTLRKKK